VRTVARFHNLGLSEGDAWDLWIESLKTAQWAPKN